MQRYNLWITEAASSRVVCWGDQQTMNEIAFSAFSGMACDVHVLPDGDEPQPISQPCES